jgi:hypothetical protein
VKSQLGGNFPASIVSKADLALRGEADTGHVRKALQAYERKT